MKVRYTSRALKSLESLPEKHIKQILDKILSFSIDKESILVQSLKGFDSYFRMKSGEYRIIYTIDTEGMLVVLIVKRNDDQVYKELKRLLG